MMTTTEMTPVTGLYVRCSYPLRPDALAASDTCQHPANTSRLQDHVDLSHPAYTPPPPGISYP
jgi:hypothetical protein